MVKIAPVSPTKKSNKLTNVRDKKGNSKVKKNNKMLSKFRTPRGRKIRKKQKKQPVGVVYLSHIPHGFYELEIENYFSQFGKVTAVSVPRSKSGRARGYAFIEYKHPEIAMIAAETMNNYLMFNRLLKAKYIPTEQQKPRLFLLAKKARENNKTAAEKAALVIKHNRKVKNRHLKLGLEAKYAAKLLKKKMSMIKRFEELGMSNEFMVDEGNLQGVFQRRREHEASKKNNSGEDDPKPDGGDTTDSSAEQSSGSEDSEDIQSLEDIDFSSEDMEEDDFSSESVEEDYKKIISKAKATAKRLLKKNPKTTNLQKQINKDHDSAELESRKQKEPRLIFPHKEIMSGNEKLPINNKEQKLKRAKKSKRQNTSLEIMSPKKTVNGGLKLNKRYLFAQNSVCSPSKKVKVQKRLNKNDVTTVTAKLRPSTIKPQKTIKPSAQTSKKSKLTHVIMEVGKNGERVNLKSSPNVVKKSIETGQQSSNKISKKKIKNQICMSQKKTQQSPKVSRSSLIATKSSPSPKKLRHRNLKKMLNAQV